MADRMPVRIEIGGPLPAAMVDEFVDEVMHLQDGQIVSEDELHHE